MGYQEDSHLIGNFFNGRLVTKRPGLHEFVRELFEYFPKHSVSIGVFTSMTRENGQEVCKYVFGPYYKDLVCDWYRDQCDILKDGIHSIKSLNKIQQASPGLWQPQNIYLIDNNIQKCIDEEQKQVISIPSFDPKLTPEVEKTMPSPLEKCFLQMAEMVKKHPKLSEQEIFDLENATWMIRTYSINRPPVQHTLTRVKRHREQEEQDEPIAKRTRSHAKK